MGTGFSLWRGNSSATWPMFNVDSAWGRSAGWNYDFDLVARSSIGPPYRNRDLLTPSRSALRR